MKKLRGFKADEIDVSNVYRPFVNLISKGLPKISHFLDGKCNRCGQYHEVGFLYDCSECGAVLCEKAILDMGTRQNVWVVHQTFKAGKRRYFCGPVTRRSLPLRKAHRPVRKGLIFYPEFNRADSSGVGNDWTE